MKNVIEYKKAFNDITFDIKEIEQDSYYPFDADKTQASSFVTVKTVLGGIERMVGRKQLFDETINDVIRILVEQILGKTEGYIPGYGRY